jgi:hypothetical protein
VGAKRSRDLNRLLDKPGPGARVSSHRKYLFWKLPRFEVVPGNLESEKPFRASRHGARKRVGAFIGRSSRIAYAPMPQLMGTELPMSAKVRDVYMVTVLPGWESESGRGPRTWIESGS